MAHHNFYESLGLDRSKDAATLGADIDKQLASSTLTDAKKDELQVAREVLGHSGRRAAYDSKLDDPNAPTITVAALRELARADFGPDEKAAAKPASKSTEVTSRVQKVVPADKPAEKPKLVKPKPKQYFPDTDPSARAVTPEPAQQPQPSYPPQYQYPPQYPYPAPYPPQYYQAPAAAPAQAEAQPEEKKKKSGASILLILAILAVLAGIGVGGWWLWDNRGEPWEGNDQALADAFPRIISEEAGQRGWYDMKCESKDPETGQKARIRCSNQELGVSVMDYGTQEARDAVLPDTPASTIGNDKCSAKSFKMEGVTPPAYTIAPEGADSRYLIVVNGDDAETKRMHLNMCDKTRE